MGRYEQLGIWKNNIGFSDDTNHPSERERLRASYRQFWTNAVTLSREIQRDLPQLTLHDDAHFEALWERVDQIAGQGYKLTPLEVFLLGGAILLHDAANSLAAFPGRLAEVQATPEWRDAVADWIDSNRFDASKPIPKDAQKDLLLETLRSVHAERARALAAFEVKVGDERHALLQDAQLRMHFGPLIGEIAASHHWDISTLRRRLGAQKGSLTGMPSDWTIRPVLLACLLRSADATQLDQDRAPDFLYGLLKLHGLSETHWRAQNRLAHPHIDSEESSSLVFTSTRTFDEYDAPAWWIAHDAIGIANRELQAVDSLLRDARLPTFQINRVRGAESPDRLAEYLMVDGWRPISAEVRISRVDKVVDMFGGEKLYGHQMSVPVRELIQNSADAVRFRRELEPPSSGYEGKITVRIKELELNGEVLLEVEDDGIGMSEAVMTGPLIDFGASYISSSLVKSERPGLLSKGRKRIGKFGVGFFAVFMLTDEVDVVSRSFDAGLNTCRTLKFSGGRISRPILLDRKPNDFSSTISTRVSAKLSRNTLLEILTFELSFQDDRTYINARQLVGMLCPMLDVDVFVEHLGKAERVHSRNWHEEDRVTWMRRILLPEVRELPGGDEEISEAVNRLRFIDPTDASAGLAAISKVTEFGGMRSGVATVGTLRAGATLNMFGGNFIGTIDHEASDPRRGAGRVRANACLALWASEQARLADAYSVPLPERQNVAERVAQFGGNAEPIASIRFNGVWMSLKTVFEKTRDIGTFYVPVMHDIMNRQRIVVMAVRDYDMSVISSFRSGELEYTVPTMEAGDSRDVGDYFAVPTEVDPAPHSFLVMFKKLVTASGMVLEQESVARIEFARYIGESSPRDGLYNGKVIAVSGLRLTMRSNT